MVTKWNGNLLWKSTTNHIPWLSHQCLLLIDQSQLCKRSFFCSNLPLLVALMVVLQQRCKIYVHVKDTSKFKGRHGLFSLGQHYRGFSIRLKSTWFDSAWQPRDLLIHYNLATRLRVLLELIWCRWISALQKALFSSTRRRRRSTHCFYWEVSSSSSIVNPKADSLIGGAASFCQLLLVKLTVVDKSGTILELSTSLSTIRQKTFCRY